MKLEKLINENVAADCDLLEWQQTFMLLATSSVAKKIVLAQARVRERSNARLAYHDHPSAVYTRKISVWKHYDATRFNCCQSWHSQETRCVQTTEKTFDKRETWSNMFFWWKDLLHQTPRTIVCMLMSSQTVRCPPSVCWMDVNIPLKASWFLCLFLNSVKLTSCLCSQVLNKQCLLLW